MTDVKLSIDGVNYLCTPISSTGLLLVPVGVIPTVVNLDALTTWLGEHDTYTGGTAVGATSYPITIGGRTARAFTNAYTNNGGFRYHTVYGSDVAATHFVYSCDLWITDPTQLGQVELDNNQVTADGKTYIYGTQCNSNDGTWDVTMQDTACHWKTTPVKGNPKTWPTDKWLHYEGASHRDAVGNITYDAIHFDGVTQQINLIFPSARNIGWKKGDMLVNFQINGGNAAGTIIIYASNTKVAWW